MGGGPEEKHRHEKLLIIFPAPKPTAIIDHLHKNHPYLEIEYIHQQGPAKDLPNDVFKDATILSGFVLPDDPIKEAPNLRLVHWLAAGADRLVNHPIYTKTDVILTTSNGVHGPQIAEWVIMTALVQSHNYNKLHDLQKEHKWEKSGSHSSVHDMVGQRIGVLGYGSIGRQVGKVAKAMGMDVLAYTASPRKTKESKKDDGFIVPGTGDPEGDIPIGWYSGLDKKGLHTFLSQDLDWLVVSVPLTKDTRHLLSASEFDILGKRNAFISNIARGPILNQADLITALKDGTLRGAALDVTDPEPLPEDNPLWDLDNVTVTPHISGNGSAYMERALSILDLNLTRLEKGEKLINVVQRKRGY